MGMEISFTYVAEEKSGFKTPELIGAYFVDLFEAPDVLVHISAFGGSLESLKEAGFLPSFVERYREIMGSNLRWVFETTAEERSAELDGSWGEISELMEKWEDPIVDIDFDAYEAVVWAESWLDLFGSEAFQNPQNLQAVLPYNFTSAQHINEQLQKLSALAAEAKSLNVDLHLHAMIG